jgi:hypothetical protein
MLSRLLLYQIENFLSLCAQIIAHLQNVFFDFLGKDFQAHTEAVETEVFSIKARIWLHL